MEDEDRNRGSLCKDIYILATKQAPNATKNRDYSREDSMRRRALDSQEHTCLRDFSQLRADVHANIATNLT